MNLSKILEWIESHFGTGSMQECADSMRNADAGKYFDLVTDWNSPSEGEKKAEFIRGFGGEG